MEFALQQRSRLRVCYKQLVYQGVYGYGPWG